MMGMGSLTGMGSLSAYNTSFLRSPSSLLCFSEYRQQEQVNDMQTAVSASGQLLEYETLELRLHPPNIVIDNDDESTNCTVIRVDSANRAGTLVEVRG